MFSQSYSPFDSLLVQHPISAMSVIWLCSLEPKREFFNVFVYEVEIHFWSVFYTDNFFFLLFYVSTNEWSTSPTSLKSLVRRNLGPLRSLFPHPHKTVPMIFHHFTVTCFEIIQIWLFCYWNIFCRFSLHYFTVTYFRIIRIWFSVFSLLKDFFEDCVPGFLNLGVRLTRVFSLRSQTCDLSLHTEWF